MAGFQILLGIDILKPCIETFSKNHTNSQAICDDIRQISTKTILKTIENSSVDVIIGGPPCQGFSMAGERDPNDPRNSLFREFVRIVGDIKPSWFVMENVTGLLISKTAAGDEVSRIIMEEFTRVGYKVEKKILMSADYGVPQKRKRVIFIGTKTGLPVEYPQPTHAEEPYVTVQGKQIDRWVPVSEVLLAEDAVDKRYFHTQRMIDGFVQRKKKHLANGNGFGWQILKLDKPSYTISARYWKDGGDALVMYSPTKVRMLTELECARIQSFPDSYVFMGGKKSSYQQIGNAVPPLLGKAIASQIKKALLPQLVT
jgi:DNA (cytosine-5)-methyltransferase 1